MESSWPSFGDNRFTELDRVEMNTDRSINSYSDEDKELEKSMQCWRILS